MMDANRTRLRTTTRNRFRTRKLATAAGAVGMGAGFAGTASPASATIIFDLDSTYTTGSTFTLDGELTSAIEIQLDVGMGMNPSTSLSLDSPNGGMMGVNSTVEFAYERVNGTGPRYLKVVDAVPEIAPSPALDYRGEAFLVRNDLSHPTWTPGDSALIGFTFEQDIGGTVYGWLQLTFDSTSAATIDQWAYEDSGDPIIPGHIPEPGTALLLGLGLALLGGTHRRLARPAATRSING